MGTAWIMGAFASGLGIGIGGIFAWIFKGVQQSFIYALCTGLIIGLLAFEMIPESLRLGGWGVFFVGAIAGITLFRCIHHSLDKVTIITRSPQKDIFVRTGIILTISISVHNFPMGFVLGSNIGSELAGAMVLTLLLHNIPEGIIIFTPLFLSGFGILTWMLCTMVVTLPIIIGSLLGQFIDISFPFLLAFIVNITISIILMVAIQEIFKESIKQSSWMYSLIVGMVGVGGIYLYLTLS